MTDRGKINFEKNSFLYNNTQLPLMWDIYRYHTLLLYVQNS